MFRLLGLHPGPDISAAAAASLAAVGEPEARRTLGELTRAHLTAEHAPGRYAFHDLLRAYAAAQARDSDRKPERQAAVGRVLDHYLHTAGHGSTLVNPVHEPVALARPRPGTVPERPADPRQALAWFEAEHHVLLATIALANSTGFAVHAWQLAWAMAPFLRVRGHHQEQAATQRTALAATNRLGDTTGRAISSRLLGAACAELGDHDQARTHLIHSLDLCRRLGNRLGEAKAQQDLNVLAERQGRYADALRHAQQALRLYQATGHKAAEVDALNNVGWQQARLGDYEQARVFCRQALAVSGEAGHRQLEGNVWDSLGYVEHHLGNLTEALACYQRALGIFHELSDRFHEADTLTHIADARRDAGEPAQARQAWQQALAMFEDMQHPDADQVRAKLDGAGEPGR